MAKWDTADLVARFKNQMGRPATDQEFPAARIYEYLSTGQDHWHRNICQHVPGVHWNDPPVAMTTPDGGRTYEVLGVTETVGPVEIRAGSATGLIIGVDQYILVPSSGLRIRRPLNLTFPWVPYARYAAAPGVIDGSTQPSLNPPSVRILAVYHACELAARKPPFSRDPAYFVALQQKEWNGDPSQPGDIGILDSLKLKYGGLSQAQASEYVDNELWYRSVDFGARA